MKLSLKLAAILALGFGAMIARADIVITAGNTGSLNDSNLLFNGTGDLNSSATTTPFQLIGHLNTTTAPHVTVEAAEPFNAITGGGQATIQANDGGLDYLKFFLGPPQGGVFTSLIFNLNAVADGSVTITAIEGVNPTCLAGGCLTTTLVPLALDGNGSNWFTTVAIDGQNIANVFLTSSVDLSSVRQVRLGGENLGTTIVPEPSAMVLLVTFLGALAFWKRKRFSA